MKKILIVFAAAVAALTMDAAPQKGRLQPQRPQQQRIKTAKHAPAKGPQRVSRRRGGGIDRDRRERLSGHDRRLIDAIEDADSLHELRRYLQSAASSHSEDVRMAMVEALEEKGGRSAADLAYFIADPDEDVASAAFSAWSSVLDDAHGGRRVRAILETADVLRSFSGGLWERPTMPPTVVPVAVPVAQPVTAPVTVPVAR